MDRLYLYILIGLLFYLKGHFLSVALGNELEGIETLTYMMDCLMYLTEVMIEIHFIKVKEYFSIPSRVHSPLN